MERVAAEQAAPPHDATVTRRVAAEVAEVEATLERDGALHRPGRLHACSLSRSARTRSSYLVYDPAVPGPLEGVRVVELGVWVAGPGAGGILADWGADVIKIEPPAGDPARQFAAMLGGDLPFNPPFELDNRGKRSVPVYLTDDADKSLALELLDRAD